MDIPFPPESNTVPYRDRASAGRWLAKELAEFTGRPDLLVLAIPRGGVPVAAEIARGLGAPLEVFLVQKVVIGNAPSERTVGSITPGGVLVLDPELIPAGPVATDEIAENVAQARARLLAREQAFRPDQPPIEVAGRLVLLVDDGATTGRSLRAAVAALRSQNPSAIVVAVPVASAEAAAGLSNVADRLFCPTRPEPFFSIGLAYERFPRLTDEDVVTLLGDAARGVYSDQHDVSDSGPYVDGAREHP